MSSSPTGQRWASAGPTAMTERTYQMTRISAGDYILPSNDGQTLWRIHSYQEDGSLVEYERVGGKVDYDSGRTITGTFWAVSRYDRPWTEDDAFDEDFLDWERWRERANSFKTRRAAIDDALTA